MTEIYPEELSLTSNDAVLQSYCLNLAICILNFSIKEMHFGFSIANYPSGNVPATVVFFPFSIEQICLDVVCVLKTSCTELNYQFVSLPIKTLKPTCCGMNSGSLQQTIMTSYSNIIFRSLKFAILGVCLFSCACTFDFCRNSIRPRVVINAQKVTTNRK